MTAIYFGRGRIRDRVKVGLRPRLTDTREFGVECHRILPSRFSLKYTIHLGILGHLINNLETNKDHHENREEILNKYGWTDK